MRTLETVVKALLDILKPVAPILIGLALVIFFYGLIKFIAASGKEESIAQGRRLMTWGIIALFVIVSVWGLVGLLSNTFGDVLDQNPDVDIEPLIDYKGLIK